MKVMRWASAVATAAVVAMVAAACGSSSPPSSSASSASASAPAGGTTSGSASSSSGGSSASLNAGSNKQIVYFSLGLSNVYIVDFRNGMQKVFSKYGYTLKTFDSNFNQALIAQQTQQYVATGQKPAGIVFQPVAPAGSDNLTSQLSKLAPVIEASQQPIPTGAYGYGAVSQTEVGKAMGEGLIEARKAAVARGMKLHSKGGTLIYFDGSQAQPAAEQRWAAIQAVTKSDPFTVINHSYGVQDADQGYQVANPVLPKYTGKVDFILSFNGNGGTGVIRAAKAAGYDLGKTTVAVSGDCVGADLSELQDGELYGVTLDPGYTEGELVAASLVQRIATGKVTPGTDNVPLGAELPAITDTPPMQNVYQPNEPLTLKNLNSKYLGTSAKTACFG